MGVVAGEDGGGGEADSLVGAGDEGDGFGHVGCLELVVVVCAWTVEVENSVLCESRRRVGDCTARIREFHWTVIFIYIHAMSWT